MSDQGDFIACTIIAGNYLAHARTLTESFLQQHPGGRLYVLLVDRIDGLFDPRREQFHTIELEELQLPELNDLLLRYDLLELCTAVKPALLQHLLDHVGVQRVCYLDPDIRLYRPLDAAWKELESSAICLTPHCLTALDSRHDPAESWILQSGVYNLGFIGLSRQAQARTFLAWWRQRLERGCLAEPGRGCFVDQKWIDFVPAYFSSHAIIRDPAYNVAYWNLHERRLTEQDGDVRVNNEPLVFFHFSGYTPDRPELLSKYQNRHVLAESPSLESVFAGYAGRLKANGLEEVSRLPNSLCRTGRHRGRAGRIRQLWRRLPMQAPWRWRPGPDVDAAQERRLMRWLNGPDPAIDARFRLLTPVMTALYRDQPMLEPVFPDPAGADEIPFTLWFLCRGWRRFEINPYFALRPLARLAILMFRHPAALFGGVLRFIRLGRSLRSGTHPLLRTRSRVHL